MNFWEIGLFSEAVVKHFVWVMVRTSCEIHKNLSDARSQGLSYVSLTWKHQKQIEAGKEARSFTWRSVCGVDKSVVFSSLYWSDSGLRKYSRCCHQRISNIE